ncbi:MAG: 4-hydroxy-tetrahydrodipicolinate reductase [Actinobacteria bacterium]|nr:4-hydroxy-tetrahydrodipicolinate reductase [Actinomycetota bacterium]
MRVLLSGRRGKVGAALAPALEQAGHRLVEGLDGAEAMVDFTTPDAVVENVRRALAAGVPCVVGTTGADLRGVGEEARSLGLSVLAVPNFAVGAILMMRFAEEAARYLPAAAIVELHNEEKRDAPSGTARATAERLGGETPVYSVRLPGLVAHQEVLLGGSGESLTLRHDSYDRASFMPGVLLGIRSISARPGLTVGLEALLDL